MVAENCDEGDDTRLVKEQGFEDLYFAKGVRDFNLNGKHNKLNLGSKVSEL